MKRHDLLLGTEVPFIVLDNFYDEKELQLIWEELEFLNSPEKLLLPEESGSAKTKDGKIVLIDEIHTPDSSRYFYADGYKERQDRGESQKQLSKEFVRQWLIENGFQGKEGQNVPEMSDEVVNSISHRYIELFEKVTGEKFQKRSYAGVDATIEANVLKSLKEISK